MASYYNTDANNANLQNRWQGGNGQRNQIYNGGYNQQQTGYNQQQHPQLPHDGIPLKNLPSNPSSTTKLQNENTAPLGHTDGHSRRNNWKVKRIHEDGESGRKGFHPFHFLHVCWMSSNTISKWVNVLWPVVPAAIAVHFALPDMHVLIFTLCYIGMVPSANLLGFAGQELARKLPKVLGVLIEVTLGSLVEIILFVVLVVKGDQNIPVVRAAILGSILANLLLCMGLCFVAGGVRHVEQEFHSSVSEVGSGLMLVAGMALITPAAFSTFVPSSTTDEADPAITASVTSISRATAVILLIAYCIYVYFQMSSHHNIITEVLEADEERDLDRHRDLAKKKLTMTEALLALLIALACVSLIATFLVLEIEYIVHEQHISDMFMGLILVPLVEKVAEHLTAIDEAWDNSANMALSHILGASVQTALLNSSIAVIVGWGLASYDHSGLHAIGMDLDFRSFEAIVLILAILVTGNFLRDGKSNYLEGSLCVCVYVIVAVCAWFYPNASEESLTGGSEVAAGAAEHFFGRR